MSRTLVINSSNYVVGSNNKFVYRFPNTVIFEAGSSIGLSGISIYNSTFNVERSRGNNVIQIIWLGITHTIVIEDGYYTVNDLNFKIQQYCILNNLYMSSNGGTNIIYFVELVMNSVRYSIQLNLYPIPTELQATALNYIKPGNNWAFPLNTITPQVNILSQQFGNLIGFTFGLYPLISQATTQSFLSSTTPIISPVNSYVITCNLLNSKFSIPNTTFYSLPLSGSLGSLITSNISSIVYNAINPQPYNELVLTFFDQYFNPLILRDFDCTITLAILESEKKLNT